MQIENAIFFLLLLFSIFVNYIIASFAFKIGKVTKLIDSPDKIRKLHLRKTPLIGALSLVIFFCITIFFDFFTNFINNNDFKLILISSIVIFTIGCADDIYDLTPQTKIILLSAVITVTLYFSENLKITTFYISTYDTFFFTTIFSFLFTLLCLLTLINAYNLTDGINGLAVGIAIIWTVYLLIFFDFQLDEKIKFLFLFLTLIIINLLIIFHFNVNNIFFLGNSGTLFLAYFLGMVIIYLTNINYQSNPSKFISAEKIFLFFQIPFMDMIRVMISRLIDRKNPFFGDRRHLHHYAINFFKKNIYANLFYFFLILFPLTCSLLGILKDELIIIFSLLIYLFVIKVFTKKNFK